ncbi:MAG TPA: hypothetical protein VF505_01790 [Thermoanaerobaculia bacterium]
MTAGAEALRRGAWTEARDAFTTSLRVSETPEAVEGLALASWWVEMVALIKDAKNDLFARIPYGSGQTLLREALLVADHNAYHLGQFVQLRESLDAWK